MRNTRRECKPPTDRELAAKGREIAAYEIALKIERLKNQLVESIVRGEDSAYSPFKDFRLPG